MNFLRFMLFVFGIPMVITGFMDQQQGSTNVDSGLALIGIGSVFLVLGLGISILIRRLSGDAPLSATKMPPRPTPQPMPAPPPPVEAPAKPAKPSAPPTYGEKGYRLRLGFFFVHSLIHFVLSGFKGFLFATALVGVWLLSQISDEHAEGIGFLFAALGSAGLVVLPWLILRWFLWPISEPEWPARPVPAPQPEVPVNPAPPAPVTAPAPPTLQKPAETMVSASPASPPSSSSKDPKTPDLQRWTDRK